MANKHLALVVTMLSLLQPPRVKSEKSALLVIDVQNCFLPGGSLAVNGGEEVIPLINGLRDKFDVVAFTRDWHPANHISFASKHNGYYEYI